MKHAPVYSTLAAIAFDLRFANLSDDESARIPAPWGYDNVPQPVRTEANVRLKAGRNPDRLTYTEIVEHFADGSSFAFAR